ncbi:SET domain-containing protein-lysine N-methyltransferase [Candidatus Woesearchaeota archaeon]|nr:SET domain-containing protein-lysine N-methyltransferase [Candidatus Woesearchaeota archaeon]
MNNLVVIKESKVHGKGVFAVQDIKKGTKVIEYLGEKISHAEGERRSHLTLEDSKNDSEKGAVYIFELNDEYSLDGNLPNNDAKYFNNSCSPNCKAEFENDRIWFVSKRNIKKGEELNINYCYTYKESLDHPCKCSSKKCMGYIVEPREKKKLLKLIESLKK